MQWSELMTGNYSPVCSAGLRMNESKWRTSARQKSEESSYVQPHKGLSKADIKRKRRKRNVKMMGLNS